MSFLTLFDRPWVKWFFTLSTALLTGFMSVLFGASFGVPNPLAGTPAICLPYLAIAFNILTFILCFVTIFQVQLNGNKSEKFTAVLGIPVLGSTACQIAIVVFQGSSIICTGSTSLFKSTADCATGAIPVLCSIGLIGSGLISIGYFFVAVREFGWWNGSGRGNGNYSGGYGGGGSGNQGGYNDFGGGGAWSLSKKSKRNQDEEASIGSEESGTEASDFSDQEDDKRKLTNSIRLNKVADDQLSNSALSDTELNLSDQEQILPRQNGLRRGSSSRASVGSAQRKWKQRDSDDEEEEDEQRSEEEAGRRKRY